MRLYVGNLSYSTTEETLKTLFSNYADVASVSIAKDRFTQQSKGFGFIEIEDEIKAQRAIGGMNGKDVDGRRIRVSEAVEKPRSERENGGFGGYRDSRERNGSGERYGRDEGDFSGGYNGGERGYGRSYDGGRFPRRGRYNSDRRDYGSERGRSGYEPRYSDGEDYRERFSSEGRREERGYGRRNFGSVRFDRRENRGYGKSGRNGFNGSFRQDSYGRSSERDENSDEY